MLIIIYQDPENLGAENVIKSLKGVTEESARLLGSKKALLPRNEKLAEALLLFHIGSALARFFPNS